MKKQVVLIVDDDRTLCSMLIRDLQNTQEFSPDAVTSLSAAKAKLEVKNLRYDAVVLDVALPDGDGRDFCMALRRQGIKIPVIMLTGSDDEVDIVRGLDAGANDYVAKPFKMSALLARLRRHLSIFGDSEDAVFSIGPYMFHPGGKLLVDARTNRKIRLTEKENALLKYMYCARTQLVPRQLLLNAIWGYNAALNTHTLETHIYQLRRKIEPDPTQIQLLLTEPGGYRLNMIPDVKPPALQQEKSDFQTVSIGLNHVTAGMSDAG